MDPRELQTLLEKVRDGAVSPGDAVKRLEHMPFEDLGFAKVDHHRALRHGMAEVILGKGKTVDEVRGIAQKLLERSGNLLVTRADADMAAAVAELASDAEYFPRSGAHDGDLALAADLAVSPDPQCAGTSDIPVAQEARVTCEVLGNQVEEVYDVGVAGIHRLLGNLDKLSQARVIICCAGMEGALPSAVGGLVSCPVIAVPTSVGYGASFGGIAALLGMLNSCSSNVTVVNIDNGFGAAYVATLINRL